MGDAKIRQILGLLAAEYGTPEWHPDGRPLSTLVQTILSQNTSDANSGRAFRSLLVAFPTWPDVLEADAPDVAAAIRAGGLADIKAGRIKQTLEMIERERGALDLDFLKDLPTEDAIDWLKRLPGVGDKTAACVLLFSLGRPVLPVDTHIFRVSKRLGLLLDRVSASQAHRQLQELVPRHSVYAFHVLMIEHGRKTCKAQRPRCPLCVLRDMCPSYERFLGLAW
jgi:endonuclease-3